jgi:peptide/nickel transport system ATP-binding protein
MIRLLDATAGEVHFDGEDILKVQPRQDERTPETVQIVFQDPYSCLNPRLTVSELIAEPLIVNKVFRDKASMNARIRELMETVGLAERLETVYPHELDGGRRQRIGIARSLALKPEFIVLDEPVSALDVCIQAQILNLLDHLKKEFGYTYVFISHNLSVVKHVSDRIAVMFSARSWNSRTTR